MGGVDNQDMDTISMGCPASPMSLKWDGFNGSFTPLTTHKRMSKVCNWIFPDRELLSAKLFLFLRNLILIVQHLVCF